MKYIFLPLFVIVAMICLFIHGTARALWIMIWHFRIPTIREAYTIDGDYLFEDWNWKQLLNTLLIFPVRKKMKNILCKK